MFQRYSSVVVAISIAFSSALVLSANGGFQGKKGQVRGAKPLEAKIDKESTFEEKEYEVDGDLEISAKATFGPGVVVYLREDAKISVGGDTKSPVVFVAAKNKRWQGLIIEGKERTIQNVVIAGAEVGISTKEQRLVVKNTRVINCGTGFRLDRNSTVGDAKAGNAAVEIVNCWIFGARKRGVDVEDFCGVTITDSTISNCFEGIFARCWERKLTLRNCLVTNNDVGITTELQNSMFSAEGNAIFGNRQFEFKSTAKGDADLRNNYWAGRPKIYAPMKGNTSIGTPILSPSLKSLPKGIGGTSVLKRLPRVK